MDVSYVSEEKERDLGIPFTDRAIAEFGAAEVHSVKDALLSERLSPSPMLISNTAPPPLDREMDANESLVIVSVTDGGVTLNRGEWSKQILVKDRRVRMSLPAVATMSEVLSDWVLDESQVKLRVDRVKL